MNTMIIDLPETASLYASGYFPSPPGYHPLHQRPSHHGIHAFPPRLPGLSPIPPFPPTAGQGAAGFPFPPTHEELPLHMRFSSLNFDENMHGHVRGPGGGEFPMPPPPLHGPPPLGPYGLHAFGHGRRIPMPPPGPSPFEFPPPPELGAYGHPTPFHTHVPGTPPPTRSGRGRFSSFRAHVRFATTTVPPSEAPAEATTTATDMADTPETTAAETEATAAFTAASPQATQDDTVPDPTLPHTRHHRRHHHLHGPHHFRGLHTHHGRDGFHRHHRGHGRFGPHAHITAHGGSRIHLLVNMRRALGFSHRRGHGGHGHGLGFSRGRSFGYPYTGYPNPYYSFDLFGLDDMEGGSDPTSDEAREGEGEEEERREESARAGTEAEHHQKDDQGREDEDPRSDPLDFECLSPTLSEPSSESSWSTISDDEGVPEDGNERTTGTGFTRARNNDNHPAVEEEDYILLPPRSPSPSELDETSSVDSDSNESNPDPTFISRGRPTPHDHSQHHHSHHHHPHSHHHHHDGPHHRPFHLGPWHHFDWARARESALAVSGPGSVRGRGFGRGFGREFSRGGHSHGHLYPHSRPYFHGLPPHPPHPPPPYYTGPDFDNDTHPDFDRLLGLAIPSLGPFPPFSFPPNVDTNARDGIYEDERLDFGPGFRFGFTRGRGGGGPGVRGGLGGFRAGGRGRGGRGGRGGREARGLGLGRQGH
ncbi:hypothetical protein K435DRAFT_304577 [Dendrothele bispora CBS 962.96]|uniref:Uncharacterized protein n=1 Tax=Dendrothele bispora (strain CBS 962.96) TaxID=1314807 RepID=A0A4S8LIR4_DENBC|nr:hypothetical protein K435DRAFT_304577 [Dendrothele bispora CBS 962.96]